MNMLDRLHHIYTNTMHRIADVSNADIVHHMHHKFGSEQAIKKNTRIQMHETQPESRKWEAKREERRNREREEF